MMKMGLPRAPKANKRGMMQWIHGPEQVCLKHAKAGLN